jgi:hypothetical protein
MIRLGRDALTLALFADRVLCLGGRRGARLSKLYPHFVKHSYLDKAEYQNRGSKGHAPVSRVLSLVCLWVDGDDGMAGFRSVLTNRRSTCMCQSSAGRRCRLCIGPAVDAGTPRLERIPHLDCTGTEAIGPRLDLPAAAHLVLSNKYPIAPLGPVRSSKSSVLPPVHFFPSQFPSIHGPCRPRLTQASRSFLSRD